MSYATGVAANIYDGSTNHSRESTQRTGNKIIVSNKQVSKRISHSHNTSISKVDKTKVSSLNRPIIAATQGGVSSHHSFHEQSSHLRGQSYDFGKLDGSYVQ